MDMVTEQAAMAMATALECIIIAVEQALPVPLQVQAPPLDNVKQPDAKRRRPTPSPRATIECAS